MEASPQKKWDSDGEGSPVDQHAQRNADLSPKYCEGRKKSEESQAAEVLAIPSSSGDSQAPEVASLALKSATATASALDLKGQVEIQSEVGAALEAEAAAWKSLQPKRKIARIGLGLLPIFAWVPMAVLLTFAHS